MPAFGTDFYGCTYLPLTQVEYLVVCVDDKASKVRVSLRQADILEALAKDEELQKKGGCVPDLQDTKR